MSDTKSAALKRLVVVCKLVEADINDQSTGWYYQFKSAIEKAIEVLRQEGLK